MILLFLLAIAQGPEVQPDHDLAAYLTVVNRYRSGERIPALREIRTWLFADVDAAVAQLRHEEGRLRAIPVATGDIDFRLVEAAVLLHAEEGLLFLQAQSDVDAGWHLRLSTSLYEWSREAARRLRERAARPRKPRLEPISPREPTEPLAPALLVQERIAPRDYYLALAATSLAFNYASTARELAEQARDAAPLDVEVHVVLACAAERWAEDQLLRGDESGAARLRKEAEAALRRAIALDPGQSEARLRLGQILLAEGHPEAEALFEEAEAHARDDRGRYLARLFLGRAADRGGRPGDAAAFYRRAVEAWPDSQTARLALAQVLERKAGPAAARELVAESLAASRREGRAADPWWMFFMGPAGLSTAALDRLWKRALEP